MILEIFEDLDDIFVNDFSQAYPPYFSAPIS